MNGPYFILETKIVKALTRRYDMPTKTLKKEFLAAVAMLVVAAIALSGSTFAWFAVNNKVTATGMSVSTQVSNNLFIKDITAEALSVTDDDDFKTSKETPAIEGILEPVSTVDANSFFYSSTSNVQTSGDAIADTYLAYNHTDTTPSGLYKNAFSANYGVSDSNGATGYVDYVFCLKAVNSQSSTQYVNLTNIVLAHQDKSIDTNNKAFRAAIFTEKGSNTPSGASFTGSKNLLTILSPAGSQEFTDNNAVSSTSALGAISSHDAKATIQIAASSTEYYRVTVRLWIEGEDKSCNNTTFADLSKDKWDLDLRFDFQENDTAAKTVLDKMATQTISSGSPDVNGKWYYDGTNVYKEIGGAGTPKASAPSEVQSAFI